MHSCHIMWNRLATIQATDVGEIAAAWISPDGNQLLLLADTQTSYWNVPEGHLLWSIQEQEGSDGMSPDRRIYRDLSSGLFYPLLGRHGEKQIRRHPIGGRIQVEGKKGTLNVTGPDGTIHHLSEREVFGDWMIASFCQSGDHILAVGPRCSLVWAWSD